MSEHTEQVALVRWAQMQQAAVPALRLLFAIPNGGKRNKVTAARLAAEGVQAGVPDLCLPVARGGYHGLWIEMKIPGNGLTPAQGAWHAALQAEGYRVATCYGWDAARAVVEDYLAMDFAAVAA